MNRDLLVAQNVPPKAGTPGVVQETGPSPAGSPAPQSPLAGLMPILLVVAVFLPILLLSSRRQKKEAQARAALKKGDRVMTNAGLIGELVAADDRIAKVKIAPGVTVEIVSNTVSPFTETDKASSKALKEAKAVSDKK